MYSDEFIERVRSNTNIQRVFEAKGITLKKSGADLVCKCPFHADKKPSLHVNLSKGLWNCFGCGEGGDAIQFVRRAYGYSFREAVEYLANMANIPVEQEKQLSQAELEEQHKREVLLNAMDVVADFYVSTLWDDSEEAKKALEEASNRWDKDFLQQYRIGYAPNKYDALINYANTKGISAELLLELGMAKYSKNNNLIDVFRGRIMIPIRKRSGRYVAFTGRTIKAKEGDDTPKYINNANTPLFDKDTNEVVILGVLGHAQFQEQFGGDTFGIGVVDKGIILIGSVADTVLLKKVLIPAIGGLFQGFLRFFAVIP